MTLRGLLIIPELIIKNHNQYSSNTSYSNTICIYIVQITSILGDVKSRILNNLRFY